MRTCPSRAGHERLDLRQREGVGQLEALADPLGLDAGGLDIKFHACPLKEAWLEAGMSEAKVAKLCHIAGVVDNGTFEAAGFAFSADTWQPGDEGCCFLHVRPGA